MWEEEALLAKPLFKLLIDPVIVPFPILLISVVPIFITIPVADATSSFNTSSTFVALDFSLLYDTSLDGNSTSAAYTPTDKVSITPIYNKSYHILFYHFYYFLHNKIPPTI